MKKITVILLNVVLLVVFMNISIFVFSQAVANSNYSSQTGTLGSTYSWIDCSSGTSIISGDDSQASINWPFSFTFYGNTYTTANSLSVAINGFIRLDGVANGADYNAANNYDLTTTATSFGQIVALAMYDDYVGRISTSWVKSKVTGSAPYRILTIEYNDIFIPYYSNTDFADVQVSFYETTNIVVLKFGNDNVSVSGVDMGMHSGVSGYFNKWQELASGTNNTWIEYTPPIQVESSIGTPIAYYQNLKTAFDNVNSGKHQGEISIKINGSTTETATASLNASGTGSSSYTSVNIYPTKSGLTISGNISKLIMFVGADNVTIDGRVNAIGSEVDLQINNTSTSNTAGTSTLFFVDDASNNTIKYCTIKGSETATSSAIIVFSTAITAGNNNNLVFNNKITSSADANRPVYALTSNGTSGKENKNNTVNNNEFYNVLSRSVTSAAILIAANSTLWTISGNSFYETTSFASNGSYTYYAIRISNTSGSGFIINDNYIGGSASQCGGSAWTKTNTKSNPFYGIQLDVGTDIASSIQNNTIQNFNWSNSTNALWYGINLASGSANIGTTVGNTIGSSTGNGSITVTGLTTGMSFHAINLAGSGQIECKNNTIGSITVANGNSTFASNFAGINCISTGVVNISNNTIGSTSQANSVQATSNATGNAQSVFGIKNTGACTITIDNNTISNLSNQTTSSTTGTLGLVNGITITAGTAIISNNTIRNLSNSNGNSASSSSASVTGIALSSTNTPNTVTGNTIFNLNNSFSPFVGNVIGIYYGATGASQVVSKNFIHSLTVSGATTTSSSVYGIKMNSGQTSYSNNIISLGGNTPTTIYGIYGYGLASNDYNVFFNSVYIYGSLNSGVTTRSYAFYGNSTANIRDIRNNIFVNARSTAGGSNLHFAAYFNFAVNTNLTLDYNDYFVSGTGGTLGFYSAANKTSLPIITAKDANSLNVDASFANASGTSASDYSSNASLPGVSGTGIIIDYLDVTRSSTPKMGAIESALYIWQGSTSSDFGTASNWAGGQVPLDGAEIKFADSPDNDCVMDENRTLKIITNSQSSKKFVLNGKELTITGSLILTNGAQINATSTGSKIIFAGTAAQSIPNGSFVSNTIENLTVNNTNGLSLNGDIVISTNLSLTNGAFNIGANTLTLNGTITKTSGIMIGGASTNLIFGGSGVSTNLPGITLNNLTLNRTNGISLSGNTTVGGTLTLTTGTLNIGSDTLTILGNNILRTSGNIDASTSNGLMILSNTNALTLPTSLFTAAISNLTINGTGGVTSTENMTVNGVLNLTSANPSATKGALDMSSSSELIMGADATNIGVGDVTGIIARYSFVENHTYTFGNPNSYAVFNNGATALPTYLKLKVDIGSAPTWRSGAINRVYELIQSGGDNSIASFRCHYLDSELNGNDEDKLSLWTPWDNVGNPPNLDNGRSDNSASENWVELSDVMIMYFPPAFGMFPITLDETELSYSRWTGLTSSEWNNAANWSPMSIPTPTSFVLIPDANTTLYDPTLPPNSNTQIMSILLEAGSVLNAGSTDNAQLSLTHNLGTWCNNGGTFNPGNSTVNFIRNGNTTISGTTSFYNLHLADTVILVLNGGTHIKVSGALTIGENGAFRGVLRTVVSGTTTVEYNGGDQTVVIPNSSTNRYSNLILSGTGIKTMPSINMQICKDLFVMGTATVNAASSLTINGELEIFSGATFNTGDFNHSVKGHFDNSGTFNATSGTTLTLNGDTSQKIYGTTATSFEKLTIDNSQGVTVYTNTTINNTLELTNGHLHIGNILITLNGDVTKTSGKLVSNEQSSITFGGSSGITLPVTLFETVPVINNLTIDRAGGVVFQCNLTVNGILNLASNNPSATAGTLDMGSNTLNMGETATTVGIGDVTGIIKRNSFTANTLYTFGNQFTSMTFTAGGIMPSEVSFKIIIGTSPSWKTFALQRDYDIIQTGGSDTKVTLSLHYLDSELQLNNENNLIIWDYHPDIPKVEEHGKANQNTVENWVAISNRNITYFTSNFDERKWGLSDKESESFVWQGTPSSDWNDVNNWSGGEIPSSINDVVIPDSSTTLHDPILPSSPSAIVKTITIQEGGILEGDTATTLTVAGNSGAWYNLGVFNAGTSTVRFTGANATIANLTNFYNVTIANEASLTPEDNSVMRISGELTLEGTGILRAALLPNTIEFNGLDQIVINPNGITQGYYNLILTGSGNKTLPNTDLSIAGDFSILDSTIAIANSNLLISGGLSIGENASFQTGNYNHIIKSDFENNGTFTASSENTITMNGLLNQTIRGTHATDFNNLTIDNNAGVNLDQNISVNSEVNLINGNLSVGEYILEINGTIAKTNGFIDVIPLSSIYFGGSGEIQLNEDLFSATPTLLNLTIDRAEGVILGNQDLIINNLLNLVSGTLTIASNTLTIAGSSPETTSGNIDASDANATIDFANSIAISLSSSLFNGNINNFTISGNGGITAGSDISVTAVLTLSAENPTSTKGILDMSTYILDMGENSTTNGIGDVTGVIRRQHTFSNETDYSFGNQYTTINFLGVNGSTKPTWIKCKVVIGSVPTWRGEAVKRYYSFAQSGGTDRIIAKLRYLDSELHDAETDESKLVFWDAYDPAFAQNNFVKYYPRNKNDQNTSENWIQLTGPAINYVATSANLDVKQWGLSYTNVTKHVWTGNGSSSYDGDWSLPGNWAGGVPTANDDVLIPKPADLPTDNNGDYPFVNYLSSIVSAEVKSIEIEEGANVNGSNYQITIYGDSTAWINNGTFIPGNGTIIFANGDFNKNVYISGNTQFNNLTITNKTNIIPLTEVTSSIKGDFVCNGSFNSTNSNTVVINGSNSNQTISGSGIIQFENFTMNNTFTNGKLTLEAPISISKTLTLINNVIYSDTINYLELANTADVSPAGGSSASFIDGPIRKIGNTAFNFPIGNNGKYAPLSISDANGGGNANDSFTAYYLNENPGTLGLDILKRDDSLNHVSTMEYWMIERNGTNNVAVTLSWDSRSGGVSSISDLRVAHWNGVLWENKGITSTTGDTVAGTISSELISSFSPFTLASTQKRENPLPVSLIYFEASCNNSNILLDWKTASEINNKVFEIERSENTKDWQNIGKVDGAGTSNSVLSYRFADNLITTNQYYRLKQIDFNSVYSYSKVVSTNCNTQNEPTIVVYPNPTNDKITVYSNAPIINSTFCITNKYGQVVLSGKINENTSEIDLGNLSSGIYFITIRELNSTLKILKIDN